MIVGAYAKIFFLIGVFWGITAFMLLIAAWRAAAVRNTRLHRPLMVFLTVGAWAFISTYLLRYSYPDEFSLNVPSHLVPWIAVHGTIALLPLFGATLLVWARFSGSGETGGISFHFNRHHRFYGRVIAALWLFTHAGGIFNFWLFRPG